MSPIHSFPNEDMYEPQYLDSFQNTAREDSPVEVTALTPTQPKLVKRRQKRTVRNEYAPLCVSWTNEEEIVLCKGWVHVSENSILGNARRESGFWNEVVAYVERKTKTLGRRTYDMVNGKWMMMRPNVARFCEVFTNVMHRKIGKRYKTSDSSSFNTESRDSSVNLNVDAGGDEEDEVQEVAPRPIGRDKAKKLKKKGVGSSGTSLARGLYIDQRLSISEEALGAFGKSQTYRGRGYDRGRKENINKSKSKNIGEIKYRGKEVNMAVGGSDDALVCCVENTVEDRIMDSGASFHATYCKEELERFKLCSGKVRLADDKTLDIAGIGDVVLKTSFSTSWTLKDVRYIPDLNRKLISVGRLDEEGYHIGFRDQQWKVTKGSLVVARGNKRGSLYMVEAHPEGIGAIINGSGSAAVWFGEAEESSLHNVSEDKETAETAAKVVFGVAKRLSRTFRAESTGIRAEASKMLWADLVSTTYLIYHIPYVLIGLRIIEEEWRGKDTSLANLKVFGCDSFVKMKDVCGEAMKYLIYGAKSATDSSNLTKPIQESQVVLANIPDNLAENYSIVAEHGLSSEITQSPDGSLDTSEGSENSGIFEDNGRLYEEDSEDGASSEEGGSKTPQVRRSSRESRAPVSIKESVQWKKAINEEIVSLEKNQTCSLIRLPAKKNASQRLWMFKVKEEKNSNERCSEKHVFGYVLTVGVTTVEWESRLQKSITIYTKSLIHLVKNLKVCSWANLVRILISEGSLSLLKILGTKSVAEMFTGIPCIESLIAMCLVSAACPLCSAVQKGAIYRTEVCASSIYPNRLMVFELAMHNERAMEMKKQERVEFLEIKKREIIILEQELAMQEYKQRQKT
ncbi:retrovirus-related pol polyprotein from transposon TNT 1-94 [Tanacetum coccineum]